MTAIEQAISSAGGQQALAELLGVTQQAISKWRKRGWLPTPRARQVAGAINVPLEDLVSHEARELLKEK